MKLPIDQLRNGRWRLRAQRRDGSYETIDYFASREQARRAREATRALVDEEALTERPTLRVFGEEVLDQREADGVRSIRSDRSRWRNHVRESRLARLEVPSIRTSDMRAFRDGLKKTRGIGPKTRREVFLLVRLILDQAVETGLLRTNPARGLELPPKPARKAFSYLYPEEEVRVLRCTEIPIHYRVLFGFLAREGMRKSEATRLEWTDLDLERGVVRLDQNKTDDPRAWALGRDVVRALTWWRRQVGRRERHVFPTPRGGRWSAPRADRFRELIELAGLDRAELYTTNQRRQALRIHDLRATFATLALASGRSERWVKDRTGHTTDTQLEQYRRAARTAAEVGLGWLVPLDEALPEIPRVEGSTRDPREARSARRRRILAAVVGLKTHGREASRFDPGRGYRGVEITAWCSFDAPGAPVTGTRTRGSR